VKKNPIKKAEPSSSAVNWYAADSKIIVATMQRGLKFGIRLNMAQVVRMLVRNADLKKLTAADYQKASTADDRRRTKK
jgi:hypothetical protein